MVIIQSRVKCNQCNKPVDKSQALVVKSMRDKKYECSQCYKMTKENYLWGLGEEIPTKKEYYCERCNYRFKSKARKCPYCNKEDQVIGAHVTAEDLL